jgi:ParB family chromosome partitioning protein
MTEDLGQATIDLLRATKAIVDRDVGLGFVTQERLRYGIVDRKRAAAELSERGMSSREIAEITGASPSSIQRDLRESSASNDAENASNDAAIEILPPEDDQAHIRGTFGTGENEWYTPEKHIILARKVLGGIDLDPASSAVANKTVDAAEYFTEIDDGLKKNWNGRVWLNPPYAQPDIAHFADKMIQEWNSGRVESAIVLTHNYTDTVWFQSLIHAATAFCLTRGRVRFVSPSGQLAAPTQGQAFFYFGKEKTSFCKVFKQIGSVVGLIE